MVKKARVFATDGTRPVLVLRAQWEFATEAGWRVSLWSWDTEERGRCL
jgi:hypothetical protein